MPTKLTIEVLNAAVLGFEQQKRRIDEQIAEIRQTLGGGPKTAATPDAPRPKRKVSAAARRRMAAAQRKRWAAIKAQSASAQSAVAKAPAKKRAAAKKAVAKKAAVKKAAKKTASRKAQKKAVKAPEAAVAATA